VAHDLRPAFHDFDKVVAWLYELRASGYYGDVGLKMLNGQIAHLSMGPTCKPGEEFPILRPRKRIEAVG